MQLRDAGKNECNADIKRLTITEYELKQLLYDVLSEFGELLDPFVNPQSDPTRMKRFGDCETFKRFGEILYKEKPIILSFNYDDFVEKVIERASNIRSSNLSTTEKFGQQITDQELGYSYWNWNRALGYGIKFDETMMYDGGLINKQKYFDGDRFYSHPDNNLYSWYLLKLHGSLNWFRYLYDTPNIYLKRRKSKKNYFNGSKKKERKFYFTKARSGKMGSHRYTISI